MQRRYIDTITITENYLVQDIMNGLLRINPNYSFDIYETKDKHGAIIKTKIKVFMVIFEKFA